MIPAEALALPSVVFSKVPRTGSPAHKPSYPSKTAWSNLKKESVCQCRRCKRSKFDPWGGGRSPGLGNSNPVQYSCLDNPMDRGAWRATIHGVSKSWTRLSMAQKEKLALETSKHRGCEPYKGIYPDTPRQNKHAPQTQVMSLTNDDQHASAPLGFKKCHSSLWKREQTRGIKVFLKYTIMRYLASNLQPRYTTYLLARLFISQGECYRTYDKGSVGPLHQ